MHALTLPDPQKQRLPDDPVSGVGEECKFYAGNDQGPSPLPGWVSGGRGDVAKLSDALFKFLFYIEA